MSYHQRMNAVVKRANFIVEETTRQLFELETILQYIDKDCEDKQPREIEDIRLFILQAMSSLRGVRAQFAKQLGCASRPPIQIEYMGCKVTVEGSERR